jgi:hypothetical protein
MYSNYLQRIVDVNDRDLYWMFSVIVVFLLLMFIWIGYTLLAGRQNLQKGKISVVYELRNNYKLWYFLRFSNTETKILRWRLLLLQFDCALCWNFQTIYGGYRNRIGIGLSYRPAKLHNLAESVPWNRFLGSLKV